MSNDLVPDPIGIKGGNATTIATAANPVPVVVAGSLPSPTGTQDVNILQFGSVLTTLGQKLSALSMPVVLSTEQQAILASSAASLVSILSNTTSPTVNQGAPNAGGAQAWPVTLAASATDIYEDPNNSTYLVPFTPVSGPAPVTVTSLTPFVGNATNLHTAGIRSIVMNMLNQAPAGAAGNYYFQFHRSATFLPAASGVSIPIALTNQPFVVPLDLITILPNFRVRVEATTGTPFSIEISTQLSRSVMGELTQVAAQPIVATTPLKNGRNILAGQYSLTATPAANGTFPNVPSNLLGYLFTTAQNFLEDVQLGRVPGHSMVLISGKNDVVGTTTEDLWNPSSAHTYPVAAAVVSLVSTSALDTAAGTGVQSVLVEGLDTSFNYLAEIKALTGLLATTTTGLFLRVFKTSAAAVGTGGKAAGDITASVSTFLQAQIDAGYKSSFNSHYTVPAGKTALVVRQAITTGGATQDTEVIREVRNTQVALAPFLEQMQGLAFQGSWTEEQTPVSAKIPEKYDVRYTVKAASGTTKCRVNYTLMLIDTALVA